MKVASISLSSLKVILFISCSLSIIACDSEDDKTTSMAGEMMAGEINAGETMAGEMMAGEMMAGETMAGEMMAGEMMAGEMMAGEMIAGEMNNEPLCRGGQNYGYTEEFSTINLTGVGPFTAPQLVELDDDSWMMAWLSSIEGSPNDINYLHVQRLDSDFQAQGEAVQVARAKGGQYQLHGTSNGVMLVWVNQRSDLLNNEGVYLQAFDTMAVAQNEPLGVNQSFNVSSIDSAWSDGFGGVLVMSEPQKISAITFNQMGLASAPEVLSESNNRSPVATFTGGGWSVAWLTRPTNDSRTYDISVVNLNDQGALISDIRTITEVNANGKLSLAHGNGIYSLAWTFPDPTSLEPIPRQIIGMRLLDETLNEIGRFFVMDGSTDLSLHGVSWIPPSLFAINWSQSPLGGADSILGVARINQLGQVLPSVIVNHEEHLYTELSLKGNASALRAVFTADFNPQPTGLFSNETVVMTAPITPCEE